jgi:hypothetical protein
MIHVGEEIIAEKFRVLDVVRLDDENESPFVRLLQVEAAYRTRHHVGRRLAGCCAEADAPAGLGAEVTAV